MSDSGGGMGKGMQNSGRGGSDRRINTGWVGASFSIPLGRVMITYSLGLFDQLEGIRGKIKKKPPS